MRHKLLVFLMLAFSAVPALGATLNASDTGACTTAGACYTVPVAPGAASAVFTVSGTFSGTIQFEGAGDQVAAPSSVSCTPIAGGSAVTSATAAGTWRCVASGLVTIRMRMSTYASGSAIVNISLSPGSAASNSGGSGAPSGPAGGALTGTYPNPTGANVSTLIPDTVNSNVGLFSFSQTGIFSATTHDLFKVEVSGNGTPGNCPESTIIGGSKIMSAITGCAVLPPSISGLGFVAGVSGYAQVDASSGGQFSNPEGVGSWSACLLSANNGRCENADQVTSAAGITGGITYGREISLYNQNTSDTGAGLLIDINGPSQPAGAMYGIDISGVGGIYFSKGIVTEDSSVDLGGVGAGLRLGASGPTSQYSQMVELVSHASGTQLMDIGTEVDAGVPNLYLSPSTGGLAGFGYLRGAIHPPQFTVSTLPSAATYSGVAVVVTDASTFTVGTCTGGGSDTMIAISNGTTWTCH